MSETVILIREILACPECVKRKKSRRFQLSPEGLKNLNIHLKMKHDSSYRIKIAEGSASFIPR